MNFFNLSSLIETLFLTYCSPIIFRRKIIILIRKFSVDKLFLLLPMFCLFFSSLFIGCNHEEVIPSSPRTIPVERFHIDDLNMNSLNFYNGTSAEYKLLLDKKEIAVALFFLKKGEEIPLHYHNVNKALYIYEGQANIFIKNKMTPTVKGDSLFVPQNSNTRIKNTGNETVKIFIFFPAGVFQTMTFNSPDSSKDPNGEKIVLHKEQNIPWENWDGLMPLGSKPTPLAWKTIIDNESMVMGITKIDPGHDVDSHFHKPTQIVIFSDGEGKTHIEKGEYKEVKKNHYIYPPSYTMHHSINTSKSKPLMEIYFFPTGPFSTIKYLGKGQKL